MKIIQDCNKTKKLTLLVFFLTPTVEGFWASFVFIWQQASNFYCMGSSLLWKTELNSHCPHQSVRQWWDFSYWIFSAGKMRREIKECYLGSRSVVVGSYTTHILTSKIALPCYLQNPVLSFFPFYCIKFLILLTPLGFCIMLSLLHILSPQLLSFAFSSCIAKLFGKFYLYCPRRAFLSLPTSLHISFHSSTSLKVTSILTKSQTTAIE